MKRIASLSLCLLSLLGILAVPSTFAAEITVTDADIDGVVHWTKDNTYILDGFVFVETNEVLNIEAGTIIKGKSGQGANASALVVARGGKIYANGTATAPIIFTAEGDDTNDPYDFGPTDRGLWGGLILLGNATLNSPVAAGTPITDNIEGIPVEEARGLFGGTDDADNSGSLRYVSIRHGGSNIGANNEINGLTLGAVGSGTTLEYIEVYANLDDGIEFFGGTAQIKYVSVAFCGDDSFDYDQGFRGKGQFWFSLADVDADNGGEHDGDIDDFTKLPLSNPTIYNATYVGNGANSGVFHRALRIRENAAGKYINSIFTDFGGDATNSANGIRVDSPSDTQITAGNLDLRDNCWWGFGAGNTVEKIVNTEAAILFTDASRNNTITDPMLLGISRDGDGGLDPRLSAGSPAWSGASAVPDDGFFTATTYQGAFGNTLWLRGWTILDASGFLAPLPAGPMVDVTDADITGETIWYATNTYVLNGLVFVEENEVLRIEAGTVIKGKPGQGASASALVVARGGKIYAEGTRFQPIIFTAEADDVTDPFDFGPTDRGLWGGLIILGNATLNSPIASGSPITDNIEGIPVEESRGIFGGTDDDDSSGVLRYVSIRHGGSNIGANNEINGLTLGAVGRGTVVEHIEVYANLDDGVEFFGGTVNTKYMAVAFVGDDSFDYDQGFRGQGQFWFSIADLDADNGGEHDGDIDDFTKLPLSNPAIYNATYVGNGADSGVFHRALRIRENAAGQYINSIFTDFGGDPTNSANGIRIDSPSDAQVTDGNLDIRENYWWGFGGGNTADKIANSGAAILFSDASRNNVIADPLLRGISREPENGLDPRLAPSSPAWGNAVLPPNDGFFDQVDFKGAFGNDLWLNGWTILSDSGFLVQPTDLVSVTDASIVGDTTWYSTNIYLLNGFVFVEDGETLTIEPGTIIKGAPGQGASASALIVARGGKIFAEGTPHNPIIFTAEDDDVNDPFDFGPTDRGLWGGLILLGKATLNSPIASGTPITDNIEGIPVEEARGLFGGSDDSDNSGVLRYVSIRHGGSNIGANNEINGLTLGAVGNGTTIEFVEVYANLDDGFEFFGGTVNTKYLTAAFVGDDSFDYDQGFRGQGQFWFSIADVDADNGGEHDGDIDDFTKLPLSNPSIYNATYIGNGMFSGVFHRALRIRENAAGQYINSIFTDFGGSSADSANGIRIDPPSDAQLTAGNLDIRDNCWWGFGAGNTPDKLANAEALPLFTDSSYNNQIADPRLNGISRIPDQGLDPRPGAGGAAWGSASVPPDNGFFVATSYKGAFGNVNWLADWSVLAQVQILTSKGAGNPSSAVVPTGPTAPVLTITQNGTDVEISFASETGVEYQLQSAPAASSPAVWSDDGGLVAGDGSTITLTRPLSGMMMFYQVIIP